MLATVSYVRTVLSLVLTVQFLGSYFEQGRVTCHISTKSVFILLLCIVVYHIFICHAHGAAGRYSDARRLASLSKAPIGTISHWGRHAPWRAGGMGAIYSSINGIIFSFAIMRAWQRWRIRRIIGRSFRNVSYFVVAHFDSKSHRSLRTITIRHLEASKVVIICTIYATKIVYTTRLYTKPPRTVLNSELISAYALTRTYLLS